MIDYISFIYGSHLYLIYLCISDVTYGFAGLLIFSLVQLAEVLNVLLALTCTCFIFTCNSRNRVKRGLCLNFILSLLPNFTCVFWLLNSLSCFGVR